MSKEPEDSLKFEMSNMHHDFDLKGRTDVHSKIGEFGFVAVPIFIAVVAVIMFFCVFAAICKKLVSCTNEAQRASVQVQQQMRTLHYPPQSEGNVRQHQSQDQVMQQFHPMQQFTLLMQGEQHFPHQKEATVHSLSQNQLMLPITDQVQLMQSMPAQCNLTQVYPQQQESRQELQFVTLSHCQHCPPSHMCVHQQPPPSYEDSCPAK